MAFTQAQEARHELGKRKIRKHVRWIQSWACEGSESELLSFLRQGPFGSSLDVRNAAKTQLVSFLTSSTISPSPLVESVSALHQQTCAKRYGSGPGGAAPRPWGARPQAGLSFFFFLFQK